MLSDDPDHTQPETLFRLVRGQLAGDLGRHIGFNPPIRDASDLLRRDHDVPSERARPHDAVENILCAQDVVYLPDLHAVSGIDGRVLQDGVPGQRPLLNRLRLFHAAPSMSSSAATPGSSRPSRNSREAPPPVEMCAISSARPACSTAATESPPPTITSAGLSARMRARARVPSEKAGISNTPMGPFQMTVPARRSTSPKRRTVSGPMSTMRHPSATAEAGTTFVSASTATRSATITSTGK